MLMYKYGFPTCIMCITDLKKFNFEITLLKTASQTKIRFEHKNEIVLGCFWNK